MRPESAKFLQDMLDAIRRIRSYTRGKSQHDYLLNDEMRDAVQWNFAIIGEALSQLHRAHAATAERIREWRRIIAFRNQLIHGYGVTQNEITWDIIESKLPALEQDVQVLLSE